jgi:dihydrolipoamide dehydrogenase
MEHFDLIVLGAGPGGGTVASRLAARGLQTALVEQDLIGGECAYWACIPSKTLLRPVEVRHEAELAPGLLVPSMRFPEVAMYRDYMIRDLDDRGQEKEYEEQGVRVVRGKGSFRGPHEIEVDGRRLTAERIVIATGSEPVEPPIEGLSDAGYWTNRQATTLRDVPQSAIVLGGGPAGIELAQMLHRVGAEVRLLEAGDRLLAREDPRVSELVRYSLVEDGIEVHLGAEATSVTASDRGRTVRFGDQHATAEVLLVSAGRRPRLAGLDVENAGIDPSARGITVDERCRAADGVWAVGDVTGQAQFTHVAMYQGRIACADIAGLQPRADYRAVPRVVFCDPEVASVGMTAAEAREAGVEVASARVVLREVISRPSTYETDPRGELEVIVDRSREVLVGAWAVGPLASEWIHYAALAIKAQLPLAMLKDAVAQFPTYTEAYLKALERLDV